MEKDELEDVIYLFTQAQKCKDKKTAFLKGMLFGIGFSDIPLVNWEIIKEVSNDRKRLDHWIEIEESMFNIHRKVRKDTILLVESILKDHEDLLEIKNNKK